MDIEQASTLITENFPLTDDSLSEEILEALKLVGIETAELSTESINILLSEQVVLEQFGNPVKVLLTKIMTLEKARERFGTEATSFELVLEELCKDAPLAIRWALFYWNKMMIYSNVDFIEE